MNIGQIEKFCLALPGATRDVKWGADVVYSVGAKMFAVAFDDGAQSNVSFKVDDERFLELTDRKGFVPAPYLARAKWVQINNLKAVSDAELKALLRRSHEIIFSKLTKKLQTELSAK